ncbi:putative cytochrome c oxidase biogenesis protein [Phaeoacremonium minimum UCRPA7]|uniref:Putative cytochrome c oxidase biogenesis protein n=1 Tax=Phaeoacremonium minimum (strain UCR-PA7) TaxID=1286976 RepID=R8BGI5_PHAM7|nr:putative cytochrome c oxidase biogenesis protein [Phaeoacremonium minimum UCRPA7]EON98332.1 putative cytochrome c oxidase biogenesis protein [Phaeoacremonium minimum UCRPA7]
MAAMALQPPNGSATSEGLPMPSRNPLPLSASQEAQVRDVFYDRVRRHCAAEIKGMSTNCSLGPSASYTSTPQSTVQRSGSSLTNATAFADCALGRTFTVPFACRETHRAMNGCMKAHATPAEEDAAREEWFAQRLERQHQREAKERRKLEQQKLLREWWNIPESERDEARRRAEEEKLRRGERVGGYAAKDRRRADEGGPEQR